MSSAFGCPWGHTIYVVKELDDVAQTRPAPRRLVEHEFASNFVRLLRLRHLANDVPFVRHFVAPFVGKEEANLAATVDAENAQREIQRALILATSRVIDFEAFDVGSMLTVRFDSVLSMPALDAGHVEFLTRNAFAGAAAVWVDPGYFWDFSCGDNNFVDDAVRNMRREDGRFVVSPLSVGWPNRTSLEERDWLRQLRAKG
jgi:hypothetical protein